MLEIGLTTRLLATPAITNLVGSSIWWQDRPQLSQLPAIVLELVNLGQQYTHDGPVDLTYSQVQATCFASSILEAKQIAYALKAEMETKPNAAHSGVDFEESFTERFFDKDVDHLEDGTKVASVLLEFKVPHQPA